MDMTMEISLRAYPVNQKRAMLILAMEKFAAVGAPRGSRDAPGNMLDGIKLEETFRNLGFRVKFDRKGEFTGAEAMAAVRDFVNRMDPDVDMASIGILSHGNFNQGGQVIEFSDGATIGLDFGHKL